MPRKEHKCHCRHRTWTTHLHRTVQELQGPWTVHAEVGRVYHCGRHGHWGNEGVGGVLSGWGREEECIDLSFMLKSSGSTIAAGMVIEVMGGWGGTRGRFRGEEGGTRTTRTLDGSCWGPGGIALRPEWPVRNGGRVEGLVRGGRVKILELKISRIVHIYM